MNTFDLTDFWVRYGKFVFRRRMSEIVSGINRNKNKVNFDANKAIVGVIAACIESECSTKDEIVRITARIIRRKRETVSRLLDRLTGFDPHRHLWTVCNGRYCDLRGELGIGGLPSLKLAA